MKQQLEQAYGELMHLHLHTPDWLPKQQYLAKMKAIETLLHPVVYDLPDPIHSPATGPIKIEDIHIGFEYEEYEMDSERYLNKGMIWVKKTYDFTSPRLRKMQILIDEGKIRRPVTVDM